MATWPVHSAKARFSEVMERAEREGPQIIARRGKDRAVVLSVGDYRSLLEARPNLRDYLLGGPKVDEFDVRREQDLGREVDL